MPFKGKPNNIHFYLCNLTCIFRVVIPNANIKSKDNKSITKKIASNLFGESNLKNDSHYFLSSNPLVLFCRENKQSLQGIKIDGFDFHFCNKSQIIQTDVGNCITSNSKLNLIDGKVYTHDVSDIINAEVKDAEHVMIISVNRLGSDDKNDFKVHTSVHARVCISILSISKQSFIDDAAKNNTW